jgi:hypothetical protein
MNFMSVFSRKKYNPSMFLLVPCVFSSTNNFAHAQTLYQMSSLCRSYECMNIARVNIGVLTGWKKIKLRRISFVLGYLRMIFLWKISTTISIKHRILTSFNKKKNSILTACMPLILKLGQMGWLKMLVILYSTRKHNLVSLFGRIVFWQ